MTSNMTSNMTYSKTTYSKNKSKNAKLQPVKKEISKPFQRIDLADHLNNPKLTEDKKLKLIKEAINSGIITERMALNSKFINFVIKSYPETIKLDYIKKLFVYPKVTEYVVLSMMRLNRIEVLFAYIDYNPLFIKDDENVIKIFKILNEHNSILKFIKKYGLLITKRMLEYLVDFIISYFDVDLLMLQMDNMKFIFNETDADNDINLLKCSQNEKSENYENDSREDCLQKLNVLIELVIEKFFDITTRSLFKEDTDIEFNYKTNYFNYLVIKLIIVTWYPDIRIIYLYVNKLKTDTISMYGSNDRHIDSVIGLLISAHNKIFICYKYNHNEYYKKLYELMKSIKKHEYSDDKYYYVYDERHTTYERKNICHIMEEVPIDYREKRKLIKFAYSNAAKSNIKNTLYHLLKKNWQGETDIRNFTFNNSALYIEIKLSFYVNNYQLYYFLLRYYIINGFIDMRDKMNVSDCSIRYTLQRHNYDTFYYHEKKIPKFLLSSACNRESIQNILSHYRQETVEYVMKNYREYILLPVLIDIICEYIMY